MKKKLEKVMFQSSTMPVVPMSKVAVFETRIVVKVGSDLYCELLKLLRKYNS